MTITSSPTLAYPKLCALLARTPTRFSQVMHNAVFRELNLDYVYVAFDTEETDAAVSAMRTLGFRGFSLTIPHKERAVGLVDLLTESAREIGAVNTIVNHGSRLSGFNTDWIGIERAVQEAGVDIEGGAVVILGAGGAARAAVYASRILKASLITIVNRTTERAEKLAGEFGVAYAPAEALQSVCKDAKLIFNATPLGSHLATSSVHLQPRFETLRRECAIFEMVYGPTDFVRSAQAARLRTITGDRMLLYQAVEQNLLFTGMEPEDNYARIKNIMEARLKQEMSLK